MFNVIGGRIARSIFPEGDPKKPKVPYSGVVVEADGTQQVVTFNGTTLEEAKQKYEEYKRDWDIGILRNKIKQMTTAAEEANDTTAWQLVNQTVNKLFLMLHPEYAPIDSNAAALQRAVTRVLGHSPTASEWTLAVLESSLALASGEIVDAQGVSLAAGRAHRELQRQEQESLERANREQADLAQQSKDQSIIAEFEGLNPERQKMFVHHSSDRVQELNRAYARRKARLGY